MIIAQLTTAENVAAKHTLGQVWKDEGTGKEWVYGQADSAIVINDYVDVDPYSGQAKKCQGNGLGNGILCVARVAYTDNYYGWFEKVRKGMYEGFRKGGVCSGTSNTGLPTGTAGDENVLMTANGNYFEFHILAGQTILYPVFTLGTGINISLDQTDNDGIELTNGIRAGDKMSFKVGEDGAFHLKIKLSVADISGTDDLVIGFRKAEAYQANVDDYADLAGLNINVGSSDPGDIQCTTIVGGAATVETDTTDTIADGIAITVGVHVSAAGVVTYTIDGSAPTTVAAYTFTDALEVVPFLFFLHDADVAGNVIITDWEVGLD